MLNSFELNEFVASYLFSKMQKYLPRAWGVGRRSCACYHFTLFGCSILNFFCGL